MKDRLKPFRSKYCKNCGKWKKFDGSLLTGECKNPNSNKYSKCTMHDFTCMYWRR